ncbi:MAG: NHL repeat-containing protein [Deltaproteobacteria bacterium]|nr:NHL repeat-containing protein [Deltaproteobacteria bacterium]
MALMSGRIRLLLIVLVLCSIMSVFFALDLCFAQQKTPFALQVGFTQMEGMGKLKQIQDLFWSPAKNRLLVTDTGNNRLLFFGDSEGKFRFLSEFKSDKMALPISAVETSRGTIIVIERGAQGIIIYNPETGERRGILADGFPDASSFWPTCLALDDKDNLYVVDQGNQRIYIFDGNLTYKLHINSPEPKFTGFSAVAVAKDGNIIALEARRGIVYVFDKEGKVINQFSKRGELRGETEFAVDIAVDGQGRIYVLDSHRHQVVLLDRNGNWQGEIGEKGWKDGKFIFPYRIEVASDYRLFIVDADNNRLQVFIPAGRAEQ